MGKETFKLGDKAQCKVKQNGVKWFDCVIGEKELKEIKTGVGFFIYRKPIKEGILEINKGPGQKGKVLDVIPKPSPFTHQIDWSKVKDFNDIVTILKCWNMKVDPNSPATTKELRKLIKPIQS